MSLWCFGCWKSPQSGEARALSPSAPSIGESQVTTDPPSRSDSPDTGQSIIHMDPKTARWKVSGIRDLPAFLRALVDLAPPDSMLCLEDGAPSDELRRFLEQHSVPVRASPAAGTLWPRPVRYHLPATRELLLSLADHTEHCATVEAAVHLHLFRADRVVLQWYDAFLDPLLLSKELPEYQVRKFCGELSVPYETDLEGPPGR